MSQDRGRASSQRWRARAVALMLALPGSAAASTLGPEVSDFERIYAEGQKRSEAGDYAGAADTWTRLLDALPETPPNRTTRESVLLSVVDARIQAFERSRRGGGAGDLAQLERAEQQLDRYLAKLRESYGAAVRIEPTIEALARRIEDARRPPPPPVDPDVGPCLTPLPPQTIHKGCSGGEKLEAAWLLLALPLVRRSRREALDRVAKRLPADVVARLRARADDDDRS